jgi:hypothetical protein
VCKKFVKIDNMNTQKTCQNKYFVWIILVVLAGSKLSAHVIDDNFKKLTHKEKSSLKYFFDTAIKRNHLGHVLFFSTKPACMSVINTTDKKQRLFATGWNVWKSKEDLFQHPNFIFYNEVCENRIYIYFINKKTLVAQLASKEEYLKQLFGESFSIKGLIEKLEQKTFPSLISEDQVLLGILLGYGIESSLTYRQYIACAQEDPKQDLTAITCAAEGKIETIELENETLYQFKSKAQVHPVAFIGDPDSEEVKNLKEIYSNELETIEMFYQSKDLLRICLEKLCD